MNSRATVWKICRLVGVSLALVLLLVFATGVVSDWNHYGPSDDSRCPYCHLGHQTPVRLEAAPGVSLPRQIASVPLPEDTILAMQLAFSQAAPRAPPAA